MRNTTVFGGVLLTFLVACGGSAGSSSKEAAAPPGNGSYASREEAPTGYPQMSAAPAQPGYPSAGYPAMAASAPAADAPSSMTATTSPKAAATMAPAAPPPPPPAPPSPVAKMEEPKAAPSAPIARPAPEPRLPQAGQLTAGVWDDNRNFDFFKPYAVRFKNENGSDFAMFAEQEISTAHEIAQKGDQAHAELDVELVLDTTGSMGDELSYLQSEFDAIAAKVHARFPNVTPRWSLVVYRDRGDEYVTRAFGFTTDTTRFRRDLRAQSAAGGGDIPEAVVDGLGAGLKQTWRPEANVAKMIFWVADAPAHPGEGKLLAGVLRDAKAKNIHIYPVAASDTDPAAEYQMRSAAQLTGGRYIFLTNDSGVGNDHAEPHIPCYNVTRLDGAIVRMIQVEMTGKHVEPEGNDVIRNVGRPNKDGKCTLSSGALVASF